jgi:hypothetical protein
MWPIASWIARQVTEWWVGTPLGQLNLRRLNAAKSRWPCPSNHLAGAADKAKFAMQSAECVSRGFRAGGCGQANHKRRDGHPERGARQPTAEKSCDQLLHATPKNQEEAGCLHATVANPCEPSQEPSRATVAGTVQHRNRRVNYRKPSHLNNHSQGCSQGDIEIFGPGGVTILFNAETDHFPAKEGL